MKKLFLNLIIVAGLAVAMTACYPGGAEYTDDTDIILTHYDPEYNFNDVNTYHISDSIEHIVDEGDTPTYKYDQDIISDLSNNFDALGWEQFDLNDTLNGELPDVAIVVSAAEITTYNVYSYPWYGYWGWGWYKSSDYYGYPGYGWGYPWYGGGTYVSTYTTGTVLWRLFDPEYVSEADSTINLAWMGVLNGVMGSGTSNTKGRITEGIDQAFKQSAYLKGE